MYLDILTPGLEALLGRAAEVATVERLDVDEGETAALAGGGHAAEVHDRGCGLLAERIWRVAHHGHWVAPCCKLDVEAERCCYMDGMVQEEFERPK